MSKELPGMCARHAIITPTCRKNKGDQAVIEETLDRIGAALDQCVPGWPQDGANFHVAVTVEPLPDASDTDEQKS